MLRRLTALVACVALLGPAAACTSDGSDPTPPASPTPSPSASSVPADPVTLRLGVYGDATMRRAWEQIARDFHDRRPEVTVEVVASRDADQAMRRVDEWAGTPELPDLFVAPSDYAPGLSDRDVVQPVDQLLEARGVEFGDNYMRLGLEAFSAEQHLQCMPLDGSPLVVVYHRGLLPFNRLVEEGDERLTPETGWTWEQFTKAARLMSREPRVKGVYVEPRLSTLMALVRSDGADLVDDPRDATTLTFSDDGARGALEDILDVLRESRLTPTPEQLDRKSALARFADEQIGMMVANRAVVPALREAEVDFDVFPLPRLGSSRTVADVNGLCLAADTDHLDAAADLLAHATGPDGASVLAQTGAVVPAHLPTLNSPAFAQPGLQPESTGVYVEAVARAGVHPYVAGWPDLVERVQPDLEELFYAPVLDLDTLLPRIDEKSRELLSPEPAEGD